LHINSRILIILEEWRAFFKKFAKFERSNTKSTPERHTEHKKGKNGRKFINIQKHIRHKTNPVALLKDMN